MTQVNAPILSLIRGAEAGKRGYDSYSSYATLTPPRPVTQMTVNEVAQWQADAIRKGSKSVAVGGYQMISKTFDATRRAMGLTGDELFDADLQDRMGMHLLNQRGYNKWMNGQMTDDQFIDNLAMEWAGFPRASGPKAGRSHYDGDGLNAATVNLDTMREGLNAGRNGLDWVYEAGKGTGGAVYSTARAQRKLALDNISPETTGTGIDLSAIAKQGVPGYRSMRDDKAAEAAQGEAPGLLEATGMAIEENWLASAAYKGFGKEGFAREEGFQFDDELWKEVTTDIPQAYHDVFIDAVSPAHARAIAEETKRAAEVDAKLNQLGWTGVGLRLTTAMVDPVAIGTSFATEGAAAPFIYGAKVGKIQRFLRAGALSAGTNAGIETALVATNPVQEWENVGYAAAAGFVLGGAIGAFKGKTSDVDKGMQKAFTDLLDQEINADGSIGAARATPLDTKETPGGYIARQSEGAATTATPLGGKARFDMVGRLKLSENPITRRVAALFAEDAVGNADGSVNIRSASENVTLDMRRTMSRFYQTYHDAYNTWANAQNKGNLFKLQPEARLAFNELVGRAVRRELDETVNPEVAKVASQVKKQQAELLKFAQEKGIRGFDQVFDNPNYFARRHNIQALDDLINNKLVGHGKVVRLVAESLVSGSRKAARKRPGQFDELEYEDATDIAAAYIKSIRSRKHGSFQMNQALAGADVDTLRMMLKDEGSIDDARIEQIIDKVRFTRDTGDTGRIGSARRRLDLDETTTIKINGYGDLGIEDFLDNDVERVFSDYARKVIGAGHMEEALSNFKVPGADGTVPAHAPSWETVKGYIAENSKLTKQEQRTEFRRLDALYNTVVGNPMSHGSDWETWMRRARDYNFSRVGGQLGLAQLAELGNVLGQGGFRNVFAHIPALRSIYKKAHSGQFSDKLFNEIEAIWGFGTDLVRQTPSVRIDDLSGDIMDETSLKGLGRVDYRLEQAKRFTGVASGMSHINMALQRYMSRLLVQRFMDEARGAGKISAKRYAALGISPDMAERINAQMLAKVDEAKGVLGRKVKRINIDRWDDVDAKNAFINGVDRWTKKAIQENDIGNMPAFMTNETAKTATQFRSFMLAAWVKQLQSGIHHNDWMTYSSFMLSMLFGGLFYMGQTVVNAQGRGDKQEYLDENLSLKRVGAASFQRAGFSTFIPPMVDASIGLVGIEPIFNTRASGLKSGLSAELGNPTLDFITSIQPAATGIGRAIFDPSYDYSQQDLRRLTKLFAFQNAFVIRNGLAAMGQTLPKYSE